MSGDGNGDHVAGVLDDIVRGGFRRVMLIGAIDTGKTSFARSLADRLAAEGERVAYLDFDLGQSTVGPPGCVGLQVPWEEGVEPLLPSGMVFLGYTSPVYDLATLIQAGLRLERKAEELACNALVIDTSGMVEGGLAALLKRSKIRAFHPDLVVVLDRQGEALHIFRGLEETACGEVRVIRASPEARRRGREERAAYRRERFREYFRSSRELHLGLGRLAVVSTSPRMVVSADALCGGRLVGLDDAEGYTLSLARVLESGGGIARLLSPYRGRKDRIARVTVGPALLDEEGNMSVPRA